MPTSIPTIRYNSSAYSLAARPLRRVQFGAAEGGSGGKKPDAPSSKKGALEALKAFPLKDRIKGAFNNVLDMFRTGETKSGRNLKLFVKSLAIHITTFTILSLITSFGAALPALPVLMPIYAGVSASYQVIRSFVEGLMGDDTKLVKPKP